MKQLNTVKLLAAAALLGTPGLGHAQLVGGNVFLKGQYVEVGIGHLGYYGSDAAAPSGYHPHGSTNLGFVNDPGMDGWTVGTPPMMGDYFLPGSPFEGWDLQVGSSAVRCQGYNTGAPLSTLVVSSGSGPASGSNTAYTASGSTVSGTWVGTWDSVTITQVTTLDTTAMYFTVAVTFTNLATTPVNDLYYFRSLDPDNDESWPGGSFVTVNNIDYQMPGASVSQVTATGMSSTHPPLTLATPDTASRAVIYTSWPIAITEDLSQIYAENTLSCGGSTYTAGASDTSDIAIGLIFNIPHLATVDSAGDSVLRVTSTAMRHPANSYTIHYFYSFSPAATDSAISYYSHLGSGTGTLGVQNVNSGDDIKVFPNPTGNIVNIVGLNTGDQMTVYDMMGRAVIQNMTGNRLSLGSLPAGHYILSVSDASGNLRSRIPVQRQ